MNWLELAWEYIGMTRNNLYIFSISSNVLTFLIYGFVTGSAINGAQTAGKKAGDLANAGYDAGTAYLNNKANTINNSGQGGQQQHQNQHQSNGGNTIQIPTIFFLILAIFNH